VIEYWEIHDHTLSFNDEPTQRRLYEEMQKKAKGTVTSDEFETYKRYTAMNATANLPCHSEGPEDLEIANQNVQVYLNTNDLTTITKPKYNHCFMLAIAFATVGTVLAHMLVLKKDVLVLRQD
jgi:hypothetical protein